MGVHIWQGSTEPVAEFFPDFLLLYYDCFYILFLLLLVEPMEFICTQENLAAGLGQVVPVTGRNTQLPILQNILLEVREGVLHLTGTDLEVGVHAIVGGKASHQGSCVVAARQLFEYVQQLPGNNPVELTSSGKTLVVTTPGFRASFRIAEADDFPLLPAVAAEGGISIEARLLCQGVSDVLFAAAREESRPEIHSVYMAGEANGELRLAATDSFRLAERIIPLGAGGEKFSLLLPLPTAQEVVRLFARESHVQFVPQEALITLRGEGVELTSRLLEATYPDYQQIIPQDSTTRLTVSRESLVRALKTLLVFLPRDSRRLKLSVKPEQNTLHVGVVGGEAGEGEVTLTVEAEGEAQELLLNIQYMLDGAQHMTGDTCAIAFKGPEAPVMFQLPGEAGYVYVVMPIQA